MKPLYFVLLIIACFSAPVKAQKILSQEADLSVLTIGPGTALYDAFGHSAFRVKDPINDLDLVFNYGVYDFNAPHFYLKFAQGKLNYLLDVGNFEDFYSHYTQQNRSVEEQILNLSTAEKQELYRFLLHNYLPENRAYLYDFFYDNCATKIKDVLVQIKPDIKFNTPKNFSPKTFRTLIQNELNPNSWGSVGIDIALGAIIDKKASATEHLFLPKYVHLFFKNATLGSPQKPLVSQSKVLYKQRDTNTNSGWWLRPYFILSILAALIIWSTFKEYQNQHRNKLLDVLILGFTGVIGVIILLLWFATDHTATSHNYNLLWAFALNLLMLRQVMKPQLKPWFKNYIKLLLIMLALMVVHWLTGVQAFAKALIPFLLALAIRYIYLLRCSKQPRR